MALRPPTVRPQIKVDVYEKEKVLLITLNRPEKYNAVNREMTEDMDKTIDWFESEPSLWVLIITGAGKGFCGGQDLSSFVNTEGTADTKAVMWTQNGFAGVSMRRFLKPVICAINGGTFGGGAELAVNTDIMIAVEGAEFGFPEPLRGVHAGVGGIPNTFYRSPQLVPYLLTGKPIPAPLLKAHVFTEVVPKDQLLPTAFKWAADIVAASPESVHLTKQQINFARLDGCGAFETSERGMASAAMKVYGTGPNYDEGLKAFKEKRAVSWKDPPPLSKAKL